MTAQIANGGYKIKPHIIQDESISYENIRLKIANQYLNDSSNETLNNDNSFLIKRDYQLYERLYKDQKNIKFVKDAMFGSTNEQYGTSFKSRYTDLKYQFAVRQELLRLKELQNEKESLI